MENRTPLKARVHSPAPCLLTPNDDDRERAQVRLARAAVLRRKSGLAPDVEERLSTTRQQESNVLSKERILELHNNCIKLAAENVRLAFTGVLFSTLFSPFSLPLCVCGCYIFFVHSSGENELIKGEKRTERDDVGYCSHRFCSCGWRELQKITQRNTWDLKLIDHLSTLVEGDDEDEDNTNFQKVGAVYYIPPDELLALFEVGFRKSSLGEDRKWVFLGVGCRQWLQVKMIATGYSCGYGSLALVSCLLQFLQL
jgi:hypothetical protein